MVNKKLSDGNYGFNFATKKSNKFVKDERNAANTSYDPNADINDENTKKITYYPTLQYASNNNSLTLKNCQKGVIGGNDFSSKRDQAI